ncbi:uncharacterized protein LOC111715692 [Eurytemora carolleeae]|uniref:uncharacterized protein LOC111715692 n=1 Tax=Eurytemora carolleeae TaxID=1294199 RepID=UPI000C7656A1|nr:uncharacterized protein LOC111715692 [Eurytemora carolleeae]XP_023346820.1 uncharacterized protein LOC111715692 [Eurytemora carolleeae]|eukprot:XP_023346819.1 uncharacterized protein LOC111715692 [Eurytemora affinis]
MSIPTTWMGVPELKLFADLLGRIIVVLSPLQGEKLSSGVYHDVYLPIEYSGHQPPLFIKSTPNHFQALQLQLVKCLGLCVHLSGVRKTKRRESFGRQLRRKTKDFVKSPHPPASSDLLKSAVPLQSMSPFPTSPPSPPQSAPTSSATSTSPSTSSSPSPSPSPPAAFSQKNYRQNYRQLKRSARYHRLGEMLFTLKVLAAGNCDDEVALLEDFISYARDKFNTTEERVKRLSPSQTISLLREAHITETSLRKVKSALIKINADILPSFTSLHELMKQLMSQYEKGFISLFKDTQCNETQKKPFARIVDIYGHVMDQLSAFDESEKVLLDGKQVVVLGGDKGGSITLKVNCMKLHTRNASFVILYVKRTTHSVNVI